MENIKKYRKKPIIVEAVRISDYNINDILNWGRGKIRSMDFDCIGYSIGPNCLTIVTTTGEHKARPGDWIVKGVNDEFYAMPDDTFNMLYEPAETADGFVPLINWEE